VGGWVVSILAGTTVTLLCGGTVFLIAGLLMRSAYRRLCSIRIPRHEADLELDFPADSDLAKQDVFEWKFVAEKNRKQMTLPRDAVVAVQLCPWRYVRRSSSESSTTPTVQGLLVLKPPSETTYWRLPLLTCSDFNGAARMMKQLADLLGVPFLFSGDVAGWKAEARRAKHRPPLKSGGNLP